MKKIFNLFIFAIFIVLVANSAFALSLMAKFESTQTTHSSLEFGESDEYIIAAMYSPSSTKLDVEGNLFKITNNGPVFVKNLFTDTHSGSAIYAPNPFPLNQNHYETEGSFFIDIHAVETTNAGNTVSNSVMIYFDVADEIVEPENMPPVAQFNFNPLNPIVGDTVTFSSTSFDPDGVVVLEKWYFDDQLIHQFDEEGSSFTRTFSLPGTYSVRLQVTDDEGATDEITKQIVVSEGIIENEPPVAQFNFIPEEPVVGDVVNFSSTSFDPDGVVVLEQWFIDGALVNQQNVEGSTYSRSFAQAGTYDVRLKVIDNDGSVDEITKQVVVSDFVPENVPPVSNFSYSPPNPTNCDVVTFTSTSFDVDGFIVNEFWQIFEVNPNSRLKSTDPIFTFEGTSDTTFDFEFDHAKEYFVRLTVTDDDGATNSVLKKVTVLGCIENIPPVADFVFAPLEIFVDDIVSFKSLSYDLDGFIVNEKWYIDNKLVYDGSNETSFNHVFNEEGNYNVKLVVEDNEGLTSDLTKLIIVGDTPNIPPVADFSYDPLKPTICDDVLFKSLSYDDDGFIVNETWAIYLKEEYLKEGKPVYTYEGINETSFEYRFLQEGEYVVRLLVRDNQGSEAVITKNLFVGSCLPENVPPVADFEFIPLQPVVGQKVTFTSTSFDSDGVIVSEKWYIGDKLVHEGVNETSFNHVFLSEGSHSVRLVVRDNDNAISEITKIVVVGSGEPENVPPVADFEFIPLQPVVGQKVNFTSTSFDSDGVIVSEKWYIGDKLVHEGVNETSFNHVFLSEGSHSVRLVVRDNDNAISEITKIVVVGSGEPENVPPVAKFTYLPINPHVGQKVTFTSSSFDSDGVIVLEEWDFTNDGVYTHQGSVVEYTFDEVGAYIVRLRVTDDDGAQSTVFKLVVVTKEPNLIPVADFKFNPAQPVVGEVVNFTSTSFDIDGFIVSEKWYINGNLVYEGLNETSFTSSFDEQGSYSVKLVVRDNDGATAQKTKRVIVGAPVSELVAIISGPESPFVGADAEYDGLKSYDSEGAEIVSYSWSLSFKDDVVDSQSNSPYFDYVFKKSGRYYLTLNIINEFGVRASTTMEIYASRNYSQVEDPEFDAFGETLSVDYHYVFGPDYGIVETDEYFTVYVTVTNRGSEHLTNLRAVFDLPEWGIRERSSFFNLRAGDTKTIEIHSIITSQDYIPVGDHDALIGVSGNDIIRRNYFPMTLI